MQQFGLRKCAFYGCIEKTTKIHAYVSANQPHMENGLRCSILENKARYSQWQWEVGVLALELQK